MQATPVGPLQGPGREQVKLVKLMTGCQWLPAVVGMMVGLLQGITAHTQQL
jgi:type III secretory pathway component EscS